MDSDQQESNQTIVLCMIVKNEKDIISRAFDSVNDFVDYYCICDTGSTDGTPEVIEEYLKEHNLKGEVHRRPWVNFCHNRQEAFDLGKEHGDYIMTMDADEVFAPYVDSVPVVTSKIKKIPPLVGDRVECLTVYGGIVYNRTQFFKSSLEWKWTQPIHEYCFSTQEKTMEFIPDVCIIPLTDGDRRKDPNRYYRDALVFEEWLLDNPKDGRAWFYLAQSYKDCSQPKKAIEPLKETIKYSRWDEELYLCHLRLARYKREAGEPFKDVIHHYMDAYNLKPNRNEALCDIISYYRSVDKFNAGMMFGDIAANNPFPKSERLFVEPSAYGWSLKDNLSVCAYWVGRYKDAVQWAKEALEDPNLPSSQLDRIKMNLELSEEKLNEG